MMQPARRHLCVAPSVLSGIVSKVNEQHKIWRKIRRFSKRYEIISEGLKEIKIRNLPMVLRYSCQMVMVLKTFICLIHRVGTYRDTGSVKQVSESNFWVSIWFGDPNFEYLLFERYFSTIQQILLVVLSDAEPVFGSGSPILIFIGYPAFRSRCIPYHKRCLLKTSQKWQLRNHN